MSEIDDQDSPAFRLRPRRGPPKSYFEVKLEYQTPTSSTQIANRNSNKPKATKKNKLPNQHPTTSSNKDDAPKVIASYQQGELKLRLRLEREERQWEEKRRKLVRDRANSITINSSMSPFMERLPLNEIQASRIYPYNYILLKVNKAEQVDSHHERRLECICEAHHDDHSSSLEQFNVIDQILDQEMTALGVNVLLYEEYSNLNLIKPGKILGIGKFRTGSLIKRASISPGANSKFNISPQPGSSRPDTSMKMMPFNIIVRYDEACTFGSNRLPLVPFLNVSDHTVEQIEEPYVDQPPPSPPKSGQEQTSGQSASSDNDNAVEASQA